MKVSNWDLRPNRTFALRKMSQDGGTAMMALEHPKTKEAVAVTRGSIKFNPDPIPLTSWEALTQLPPPYATGPKRVSSWAWLTGDNPFQMITVGGGMIPVPDRPATQVPYQTALNIYDEGEQAALQFRAVAKARASGGWAVSTVVQLVLAGVSAIAALVVAFGLLPTIIERFRSL